MRTRSKAGEVLMLYTHLVVREDALVLYGFETQPERELFTVTDLSSVWVLADVYEKDITKVRADTNPGSAWP